MNFKKIIKLLNEQNKDDSYSFQAHEYINSKKVKPFSRIKNIKARIAYVAHLLNIPIRTIARVLGLHENSIRTYIKQGKDKYGY